METRANYVAVGMFTLAAIAMIFVFIYWMGRYQDRGDTTPLDVRIEGSVTGLVEGSGVLFNGIRVGRVQELSLDPDRPNVVIARTSVKTSTPLRKDTVATIGIQGLSGGAYISLEGGSADVAPLLALTPQEDDPVPVIKADPAALADIITRVNNIAGRTERIMGDLEGFVQANSGNFESTIKNVAEFSDALARNGDNLDKFLTGIGEVGTTLQGFSEKLDGTIAATEKLVEAVDAEAVGRTVSNIEQFSQSLAGARTEISTVVASVNNAAGNIDRFSGDLNTTLKKVDKIVEGIDGEALSVAITNIGKVADKASAALEDIDSAKVGQVVDDAAATIASARSIFGGVKPEAVEQLVTSASDAAKQVSSVVAGIDGPKMSSAVDNISKAAENASKTAENANEILAMVDRDKVGKAVDDAAGAAASAKRLLDGVGENQVSSLVASADAAAKQLTELLAALDAGKVNSAVDNVSKAAAGAQKVVSDFSEISSTFNERAPDIDRIVTNATELTARLNEASVKVNSVVEKVDDLLESGSADGLVADARTTLAEFRRTARTLSKQVSDVSNGINRFTARGLRDTQALINDARNSIGNLDRVIRSIGDNPSSVIRGGGGSAVREIRGGRPRR